MRCPSARGLRPPCSAGPMSWFPGRSPKQGDRCDRGAAFPSMELRKVGGGRTPRERPRDIRSPRRAEAAPDTARWNLQGQPRLASSLRLGNSSLLLQSSSKILDPVLPEPELSAREARLTYVSDAEPGIRRIRRGPQRFGYRTATGERVEDEETLARIRRLAIPPAWSDVWISRDAKGHIQATGRDDRGRK